MHYTTSDLMMRLYSDVKHEAEEKIAQMNDIAQMLGRDTYHTLTEKKQYSGINPGDLSITAYRTMWVEMLQKYQIQYDDIPETHYFHNLEEFDRFMDEIKEYMKTRAKIQAIKHVRSVTGWGLAYAKGFIDLIWNEVK